MPPRSFWKGDPMLKKRLYTFIVASHADAVVRRISIPYPILIAMGILAIIGVLTAGMGAYHYGKMALKVISYSSLLAENDAFRAENQNFRIQTAQLGEKLDYLETTSRRLIDITGMNREGGQGGYSRDPLSQSLTASTDPLRSFDTYNKNLSALEERYRGLGQHIFDEALVKSAKPDIWPVNGYVTGGWGRREDPFTGTRIDHHTGIDISASYGTKIISPADGIVIFAGYRAGYGNIVVLDHRFGLTTRYGHLSKINVQIGQRIARRDIIGYVGSSGRTTGPHLHFEVWHYNRAQNPLRYVSPPKNG